MSDFNYWDKENINQYADEDNVEKVSAAVNYPNLLTKKPFSASGVNGLVERKNYYEYLKEIFNYEDCD
ncbi:hypothetical protein [Flavobacterium sp.]|uniref:hypothetical protein n=1 Tax=Flavobacterium sp. TaxID=239 RepID=UPI0039E68CA6